MLMAGVLKDVIKWVQKIIEKVNNNFSAVLAEKDRFFGRRTFILIHFNM